MAANTETTSTVTSEDKVFIGEIAKLPEDKQILIKGIIKGILIESEAKKKPKS